MRPVTSAIFAVSLFLVYLTATISATSTPPLIKTVRAVLAPDRDDSFLENAKSHLSLSSSGSSANFVVVTANLLASTTATITHFAMPDSLSAAAAQVS